MTTPPDIPDSELLRARYGTSQGNDQRRLRILIVILGTICVLLLGWIGTGFAKPAVTSNLISFDVVDPGLTTITIEVSRPPGRAAQCTVEALSTGYAQVGVKTVAVAPSQERTTPLLIEINTSEIATTALVDSCEFTD